MELEVALKDGTIPENRKESKRNAMRRAEMQYLRFLRTKERPQNFQTIKIIGKGAFGEVKLVQRKSDGKIYALKSLVKTEMVYCPVLHVLELRTLTLQRSSNETSWHTSGRSVTFSQSLTAHGSSSSSRLSRTRPSSTC